MKFVELVDIYIYHIPYHFGVFIFKNDCFIVKTMLKAADNRYQGHPMRNWSQKTRNNDFIQMSFIIQVVICY